MFERKEPSWAPVTVEYIPHREELLKVITKEISLAGLRWKNLDSLFGRIITLFPLEIFRVPLVTGFCSSVGGLSKQVALDSTRILLDYFRDAIGRKEISPSEIASVFVEVGNDPLVKKHLLIPYFRTVNVLLTNQILDSLQPPENDFSYQIGLIVHNETKKTKKIRKLLESIEVLVGLLPYKPPTQTLIVKCLLRLLSSVFPKVRKKTAQQFYVAMITYDNLFSNLESDSVETVMSSLSVTQWDDSLEIATEQTRILSQLLLSPK